MAKERQFTAEEVEELVWEEEVERVEGENRRWSRTNTSIVLADDDKHYNLYWEEGLTEMQENEYNAQAALPVKKVRYEKTVTVEEWIAED